MLVALLAMAAAPASYEELCERIVQHAKAAARAHNSKDKFSAEAEKAAAVDAYRAAVALEPTEPQAYLHGGQAFLNLQLFDEALETFALLRPLLADTAVPGPGGSSWREHLDGRVAQAMLGKTSVARDLAYDGGQGNLTEALRLAREQIALQPRHPRFLFDAATLQAVRSGVDMEAAAEANELFARAQQAAADAAAAFLRRERPDGCPRAGEIVELGELSLGAAPQLAAAAEAAAAATAPTATVPAGAPVPHARAGLSWRAAPLPDEAGGAAAPYGGYEPRGAPFLALLEGGALHGPDGVPAVVAGAADACALELLGGHDWPHAPLHANLWLSEEAWSADGAPKLYDHSKARRHAPGAAPASRRVAVSILGFSSATFYHFVMEALPRLALLLPALRAHPAAALVVPRHKPGGFIAQLLRLALPAPWLDAAEGGAAEGGAAEGRGRVLQYEAAGGAAPGPRVAAAQLLWADWPRVTAAADGAPIHCVAPRAALRAAAAMVKRGWRAARAADGGAPRARGAPCVVWARRGGSVTLRQLPRAAEEALVAALRAAAERAGVEFVDFDGGASSVAAAVELFDRAVAVAGLHGGQLANVLFCAPGARLVELSFASPFAAHYAHAAAALGLSYDALPLEPDERGVGANSLSLPADTTERVVTIIERHLASAAQGAATSQQHDEL